MTLSPEEIDRREAFLPDLLRSAAALAAEGFRQAGRNVTLKGPQDYLTETDGKVEAHIRARLAETFPEDSFLGEESGGAPGETLWVVDPIDGTANFARGIPHFCVAIALVANGETQLGGIINPILDECYLARLGRGVRKNGVPIRVATTTEITASSFEMGWSPRNPTETYLEAMRRLYALGSNVRRGASGALALTYVAEGRSDGYAEFHMNAWDCLAGLLMVREAGGVTAPYLALGGLTEGGAVLAAAPGVADALFEATGIRGATGPDRRA